MTDPRLNQAVPAPAEAPDTAPADLTQAPAPDAADTVEASAPDASDITAAQPSPGVDTTEAPAPSAADSSEASEPPAADVTEAPEGAAVGEATVDIDLRAVLAEAEQRRDEYLDHLRRERAEFENFRRRMNRERMDALDRGAEQLVRNLLGVLDTFGFALDAAAKSDDEQLSKGVRMVYDQLLDVLHKAGLQDVPGVGEPFDPAWHEALLHVEPEQPVDHPVVVEVLRPGYRFKGRVLRPASVKVAA